MSDHTAHPITLLDVATAATLAQILPVLLLTLAVEIRRTGLLQVVSRSVMVAFFLCFGAIETVLVLSIDGTLYPFQWFDAVSALSIFGVLALLFKLSLFDSPDNQNAVER